MFRATRYFHTVTTRARGMHASTPAFEANVTLNPVTGSYISRTICPTTGRTHERYFDSLRAFATWHYAQHGVTVPQQYPVEREVNVRYKEACAAVEEAAVDRYMLCEDDVVVMHDSPDAG